MEPRPTPRLSKESDVLGSLQDAQFFLKARSARLGPWHSCAPACCGGMSTCPCTPERCTANGTKPPATVHCSPSYCVRYRCGSSATSSSAARLKRRGQQERQARERRERARKKLAATALQPGAGCSSQTPLLQREPPIFQAKKAKISPRGSAPHPAGALPQTPVRSVIPVGGYTWCPPRGPNTFFFRAR